MSELIQKNDNCATIRWKLLTGASVFVLMAATPSIAAGNTDHPLIQIELGGDVSAISGEADRFEPAWALVTPTPAPYLKASPIGVQKPARYVFDADGKLRFQPEDSDWEFSASIRYGRSHNNRHAVHNTESLFHIYELYYSFPSAINMQKFADTTVHQSERHLIVDFQVGKDVGLGIFGPGSTSEISGGVRVARFTSHSDVLARARPDFNVYNIFPPSLGWYFPAFNFATYYLHGQADRSFHGIGPSLSWSASVPIAGNVQEGELLFDMGVNGAVLFGKQKAKVSHQTEGNYFQSLDGHPTAHGYTTKYTPLYPPINKTSPRSHDVTVPNLGASIGISYRMQNFKMSFGYRADYFFKAMDGGIDKRDAKTLGFNGLYASVSIGLGD